MGKFDKGVDYYTIGRLNVDVGFPEEETKCKYCKFCEKDYGFDRWWCKVTGNMLYSVETRDKECPLDFCGGGNG